MLLIDDTKMTISKSKLLIIVPFYKNAQLVAPLCSGILSCREEISSEFANILFINDSPGCQDLQGELNIWMGSLIAAGINVELMENDDNLGFIASCNKGLKLSLANGSDVLLLNSDAIIYPGCIKELIEISNIDDMIGFVCPRSNDAGLATLPHRSSSNNVSLAADDAFAMYKIIAEKLPRYTFVPTAVGFCLLIKAKIIAEFGFLDIVYGFGYNEENDYIMRANECGYRAVLANKAYCWHQSSGTFGKSEYELRDRKNAKILLDRYPHYSDLVSDYYKSPEYRLENVLAGRLSELRRGRFSLVLNLANIGPHYNGTSEMAVELARAIYATNKVELHFITNQATANFHELGKYGYVNSSEADRRYSACLHLGQPFNWLDVSIAARSASVNAFYMLDTIAQDCGYLRSSEVEKIWRFISQTADGLFFISNYSAKIFSNRYQPSVHVRQFVTLLSTDPQNYRQVEPSRPSHLLIIGNHFKHKAIQKAVETISLNFPDKNIVVLGVESSRYFPNVTFIKSGMIPTQVVENLYANAEAVIFPSHYEGFGFPVVKAAAYGRPVITRDTKLLEELLEYLPGASSVHKFSKIDDIPQILRSITSLPQIDISPKPSPSSWTIVANQVIDSISDLLENNNQSRIVVERYRQLALLDIEGHNSSIEQLGGETLQDVYGSRSWRFTRPLRLVSKYINDNLFSTKQLKR